jgi:choline dehydrogenase
LKPVLHRPNLTLLTDVHTTRILIEHERAIGIELVYASSRQRGSLHADREVIVTAGAIGSPKLLMLSGIGPADELKAVGVASTHDLPGVGRNLQDHMRSTS